MNVKPLVPPLLLGILALPLFPQDEGSTSAEPRQVSYKISDYRKGFHLDLGGYWPTLSTKVRIDSPIGLGTEVKFEDDLNFSDNSTIFDAEFTWNFSEKWYVEADYVSLSRTSTGIFQREIVWGDPPVTYQAGALFGALFDATIARVGLGYRILERDQWVLAGTVGAHLTKAKAGIAGILSINDTPIFDEAGVAETGGPWPLPAIGLDFNYMPVKDFYINLRGDLFFIEIENWGGQLYSGQANVGYLLGKKKEWALGLGYKFFSISIDYDRDDWKGLFEYRYHGPRAFLTLQW